MITAYDKALKLYLSSFLKVGKQRIPVYGLSSDDANEDMTFTQAGQKDDKIRFPLLAVVRLPDVEITDFANTKRQGTHSGYYLVDEPSKKVTINVMRCKLTYAVDVYAENKKTAEDLGTQLYFRLRNNPNPSVWINLPVKDAEGKQYSVECVPNIVLEPTMSHLRIQNNENAQLYRFRIKFALENVNIYDFSEKELYDLEFSVEAKLSHEKNYKNIL